MTLKLCYIEKNFAYFTTQSIEDQWGDDWDDAPYEHNASPPYEYNKERDKKPWNIVKIAFECDGLETPCNRGSNYSIQAINNKEIPWLSTWDDVPKIWAGTIMSKFKQIIRCNGGKVYVEAK